LHLAVLRVDWHNPVMDFTSALPSSRFKELHAPSPVDYLLVVSVLLLVGFGLVMVYSTTGIVSQEKMGDSLFYAKRQLVSTVLGGIFMITCMQVPLGFLRKISPYLLAASLFLLLLPLTPGIADRAGGASRWVKFGPVRFQPAEFVKVFMVLFMAGFLARHEHRLSSFLTGILKPLSMVSLVAGLLLLQPDFGSTAVIVVVILSMLLASGVRLGHMALCSVAVACVMGLLVYISPYRMMRVVSFLSPFADASGKGYQLIQSLIAVGTGQVYGVGLGGSQQKLFFLPAAHTDFIFAVISEELGFVGGLCILFGFLLVMWRGLLIARSVRHDTFLFSLAVGMTMMIVAPALLNVGVVIGLLPTKGMVLPLVGYGGSSLIACMGVVGLLLGIRKDAGDHPHGSM
jgi:cell division protein FtsW